MHDYVSECADDTGVVYPAVELWRWGRVAGVWLSAGADPTSPVPSDNCFSKQAVVSWNRHCSGRLRACVVMWIVSESGDWCWVHFCEYIINGTCLCKMANIANVTVFCLDAFSISLSCGLPRELPYVNSWTVRRQDGLNPYFRVASGGITGTF